MKNIISKKFECDSQLLKELNLNEKSVDDEGLVEVTGGGVHHKISTSAASSLKKCCPVILPT